MAVNVITNQDLLVKKLDSELAEERKKDELTELMRQQMTVKNELLKRMILEDGRIDILATEILNYSLYPFHKDLMAYQYDRKKSLSLAPRDSGKSTILNYTKVVYEILRDPNIRIAIVSKTREQAETFLKEIKNHLDGNPRVKEVFGDQVGKKWDAREIIVKGKTSSYKESTITCIGVGSALVGKHFDLIIFDDVVDEKNSRTELQRERIRVWFYQSLYPTLEPEGQLHGIGTRYHFLDFYGHLMGETEHEGTGEFKNCFIRIMSLVEDHEKSDREDGLVSFWPEKFSVEALLEKKTNMGTILFNAQMQNDTEAMKGRFFKSEWFRYYEKVPKSIIRKYSGVDLAVGQTKRANKYAHVTIGLDEALNIYVLSYYERRALRPNRQTMHIVNKANEEQPNFVGIESNAYQAAKALDVVDMDPSVRVKKIYTDMNKKAKGWKVAALFEAGKIYVALEGMQRFVDHLLLFTGEEGGSDDLFDAFFNAIKIALWTRYKKKRREPGVI